MEWIQISKKLPPENVQLLIGCLQIKYQSPNSDSTEESIEYEVRISIWSIQGGFSNATGRVTHWMPLPIPPKGDE